MRLSRSLSWGLAVVVALVSGAIASVLTLSIVGGRDPASLEPRGRSDDSALVSRLEDLCHRFETALADARNASSTLPSVRNEVGEPANAQLGADLIDRLDRLERRLERFVALATPSGGAELSQMRSLPVQRDQLVTLAALARRDPEAAKKSTMLLTPREVIARFGFPDDVGGANGGGSFWNYHYRGANGEFLGGILFVFRDGLVAWHEIGIQDR